MMSFPIRDRPFTAHELERLRLGLSTFRDGSGQLLPKSGMSMPNYRDFERTVALVCGGVAGENKGIFDVLVPSEAGYLPFGVSCKMTASQPEAHLSSFMELSNSAAKFRMELGRLGIDWVAEPAEAGPAVIDLVETWHEEVAAEVDLSGSRYLVLHHDTTWHTFQLLCFPLSLRIADPRTQVQWKVEGRNGPTSLAGYVDMGDGYHRLWLFYPNSGGQLKYYPPLEWAEWISPEFHLELPVVKSLRQRVDEYFPGQWPE